jgi:hypothetical protein
MLVLFKSIKSCRRAGNGVNFERKEARKNSFIMTGSLKGDERSVCTREHREYGCNDVNLIELIQGSVNQCVTIRAIL